MTDGSMDRTFVGLGFGAIQSGLFLHEACKSGTFLRLAVPEVVEAVRGAGGYWLNIATSSGIGQEFQALENEGKEKSRQGNYG